MEAVGAKHGISFKWKEFDWSCDWYKAHGKMCPDDAPQILRGYDAVYFGAVGNPAIVPDHISAWGLLINFRRWFDLYVNLRPVRLFEGLPCPLAGRKPGDIDYYVIRENTEGEYGNVGGRMFEGTDREVVTQLSVFSRKGVDRIMKYAFELAKTRKKHVTSLHQVERHLDHHALLGRALRRDEEELSRHPHRPVPRRRPVDPDGAQPGPLRRHRRLEPVRRHPLRPRPGHRRHDRHRALGQHQSGAHRAVDLRAGARLGAGHRRQEDRQPDRPDLVRRADAGAPRPPGSRGRRGARHRARDHRRPAHARHEGQGLDVGRRRRGRRTPCAAPREKRPSYFFSAGVEVAGPMPQTWITHSSPLAPS